MNRRYTAGMTVNRNAPAIEPPEAGNFGMGEADSIVDRMLDMPPPPAGGGGLAQWEAGVMRRQEKALSDSIRERLGDRTTPSRGE